MPYLRPALTEIINRKITEVDSRIPNASARLRRSVLNALLRASAAVEHGLYGYIERVSKQVVPDTAGAEMLERHANWWGVARNPAVSAQGLVDFTGSGVIPAGTILQRSDGEEFSVDAEIIVTDFASVQVTGVLAGNISNTESGVMLSLVSAIAGIESTAIVSSGGLTSGADIETDNSLRQRLRDRVQQPPHGGSEFDYIGWAKEVSGVTRVWSFPLWSGVGTVAVFFVRDNDASFIPDAQEVSDVQAYIDAIRPVTANVTVLSPIESSQDFTISINPNTITVQENITAELNDMFQRESSVEDGNGNGTILISHIREAISIAGGEYDHSVNSPTIDITINKGEIASLGIITWQTL